MRLYFTGLSSSVYIESSIFICYKNISIIPCIYRDLDIYMLCIYRDLNIYILYHPVYILRPQYLYTISSSVYIETSIFIYYIVYYKNNATFIVYYKNNPSRALYTAVQSPVNKCINTGWFHKHRAILRTLCRLGLVERWGAGVETQKNVRGEIGGWGRVPFNETYAPSLSTIYDGA